MSRVYLVRHGQAGTRKAYDSLSPLGRQQARLLGRYCAEQGVRFSASWCGEMVRQQQTGDEVRAAYREAGLTFPEIKTEPSWNEFDLDDIYKALAPYLDYGGIVTLRFGLAAVGLLVLWPLLPGRAPRGWDLVRTASMGLVVFMLGHRLQVYGNQLGTAGTVSWRLSWFWQNSM